MYIKARDIMHETTVLPPQASVKEVAELMSEKNIGSVLIGGADDLQGILTERDIIKKVVSKGLDPNTVKAGEVMSTPVVTVDAAADIYQMASIFSENSIRRLPVVEEGRIIGILTTRDVTKSLIPGFFKDHPLFKEIKEYKKTG
jgi:signal-transduction protein with cAMP-binding, CBS, and nucleotidyltransferase domain